MVDFKFGTSKLPSNCRLRKGAA